MRFSELDTCERVGAFQDTCTDHTPHGNCYRAITMFTGRIGEKIIMSDRPIVAVDGEQILFAFDNVEDATGFLLRSGSDTTTIFRHNGVDWARIEKTPLPCT